MSATRGHWDTLLGHSDEKEFLPLGSLYSSEETDKPFPYNVVSATITEALWALKAPEKST